MNQEAPWQLEWKQAQGLVRPPAPMSGVGSAILQGIDFDVTPQAQGAISVSGNLELVICDVATHAVCVPVSREIRLSFVRGTSDVREAEVRMALPPAQVSP